ncbi:hypothetical protein [Phenylobacterium sp.]|uniref:terminase small subunit-like protein n=1 Tax=Phenylobacterium sp. TaxID=1871053 RepID=UPI002F929B3A
MIRARYTADLGREICVRLAAGERWAHMAGRGRMPSQSELYAWRDRYPAFAEALAQAREIAAEGGGDLPSNLDDLEGDLMKDEPMTPAARRPRGKAPRPDGSVTHVRYGKDVVRRICDHLAAGKTWRAVCNLPNMPAHSTFFEWRKKYPDFEHAVRASRAMAAEDRFEEAYERAMAAAPETVQADKLKVETLMKQAAALDPSQFSERRRETGPGGATQVQTFIIRRFDRIDHRDGSVEFVAIDHEQVVER